MRRVLTDYDLLVAPTVCAPAYPFDADEVQIGGTTVQINAPGVASDVLMRLTRPANIAGILAVSVPCGMTSSRLPIGLQMMGKPLGEPIILAAAHQCGLASGQQVCSSPRLQEAAAS